MLRVAPAAILWIVLLSAERSWSQVTINEVRTGPNNTEYVEFKGAPGESLGGLTLLVLGDGVGGSGVVEWRYPFSGDDVIGPNGYLVLRNPGDAINPFALSIDPGAVDRPWPLPASGSVADSQLEGSDNQTYLLVSGYDGPDTFVTRAPNSGSQGQDLDTNDDGVLDVTPWASIVDSMVMKQSDGTTPGTGNDWWYDTNAAHWCGPVQSRTVQTVTTGGVLAYWNQNSNALPGGGSGFLANAFPQPATSGSLAVPATLQPGGGLTGALITNPSGSLVYEWIESFAGSTVGALNGDAAGGSITIEGGTGATSGGVGGNNGAYLQLRFSMAGQTGLRVRWATRTSGTTSGFQTQQVSCSTDGRSFVDIGESISGLTSSYATRQVDLGGILDGTATAFVRITFRGASTPTGANRLDNITLLSQERVSQVVVSSFSAPVHGFRSADGGWAIGNASVSSALDTPGAGNAVMPAFACGDADAGDCAVAHANGGCSDRCCCESVCEADPFCCEVRWDAICATAVSECTGRTDCATPCPADLNADARVDGADLGLLLVDWGGVSVDLDGNGLVDGADLGLVLSAWGPCPS